MKGGDEWTYCIIDENSVMLFPDRVEFVIFAYYCLADVRREK